MSKLRSGGILIVLVVALSLKVAAGHAQDLASTNTTVEQVNSLQNQIAILQQKLKIANLQRQIDDSEHPKQAGSAGQAMGFPSVLSPQPMQTAAPVAPEPLPQIVSISGAGSHLSATLELPSGGEVVAYPALGLPGGMTVHDVSATGVRVIKAGSLIDLPFAGAPAAAPVASQPTFGPQVITLPTPPGNNAPQGVNTP